MRALLAWVTAFGVTVASGLLRAEEPAVPPYQRLTNNWSVAIGTSSDSSPAVGKDGTIYFGTLDGKFWAIRPDKSVRWVFESALEIKSSPAIGADGSVYFGSRDRHFYALSPRGELKWRLKTGGWVDSSPALAHDGTVYFGSWDGKFYAMRPDGNKRWEFSTKSRVVSSPAIGLDGTIYFGSADKTFYALQADGSKKWSFQTGGAIHSSPALRGSERIYFASLDGFLYALNLDGELVWKLKTGGATDSSPSLGADGTVYIGVNQQLWAVSAEGKKYWGRGVEDLIEDTPTALKTDLVCCVSRYGHLLALDFQTNPRWGYYVKSTGHSSPGISEEGVMYLPDEYNKFSAIPANISLARSPWPKFRGNPSNTGNLADNAVRDL